MKTHPKAWLAALCAIAWIAAGVSIDAADLQPKTTIAFERYVGLTELRIDTEARGKLPFLWVDRLSEPQQRAAYSSLLRGEVLVRRMETRDAGKRIDVPDGMCHHWVGTILAPGADLKSTVALMQSYNRYQEI